MRATRPAGLPPAMLEAVLERLGFDDRPPLDRHGLAGFSEELVDRIPDDEVA